MKADKRSRAFLILTIALSVCMVCSVILISAGAQEKFKNTQRNKAQIAMIGITDGQLSVLRQSKDVQWAGEYAAIGLFIRAMRLSLSHTEAKTTSHIRKKNQYRAARPTAARLQ